MDAQTENHAEGGGDDPNVLVNDNPLSGGFFTVVGLIQSYGWILLFGVIVCFYIKSKVSPTVQKYRQKLEETIANKKFDANKAQSRHEGMEAARRRMQEKLDVQAARHAEQMKEKEEEKRKQKIDDWDGHTQGKGYRSKYKPKEEQSTSKLNSTKKTKPLRPTDYSPLGGGDGASCAWRPGQRSGGGGGG